MLRVDLRQLQQGPVETTGDLAPDDAAFAGLDIGLDGPVHVEGRLQATGPGEFYWRGRLRATVSGTCRRCLVDVRREVDAPLDVLFSDDPEAEDNPDVYPLAPQAGQIDLSEPVRDELALAAPAFLLCREACAGLCPTCGADLNAGPCDCAPAEPI